MKRNRVVALATASLVGAAMLPLTAGSVGAAPAPAAAPSPSPGDTTARTDDLPAPAWKQKYDADPRGGDREAPAHGWFGRRREGSRRASTAARPPPAPRRSSWSSRSSGTPTHSAFPDGEGNATTFDGPQRNQIPKPNRKTDNSTNWRKNYGRKHYNRMYFKRMSGFYERESNGKYSVDGTVTEWVKVPFNEARYGRETTAPASPAATPGS